MPRSVLANVVRQFASINQEARRRGVDLERVIDERQGRRITRREFLGVTAKASFLAGLGDLTAFVKSSAAAGARSRIAIVGGGLAGLTCAWRLKQAGLLATIYEAAGDLGGRCRT